MIISLMVDQYIREDTFFWPFPTTCKINLQKIKTRYFVKKLGLVLDTIITTLDDKKIWKTGFTGVGGSFQNGFDKQLVKLINL